MSAHLRQPQLSIDMETVVQTALSRGYTAQGEMFSGNRRMGSVAGQSALIMHEKTNGNKSKEWCSFLFYGAEDDFKSLKKKEKHEKKHTHASLCVSRWVNTMSDSNICRII